MGSAVPDQVDGRTLELSVMVTPDEAEAIAAMARAAGLSVSAYLRRQVLRPLGSAEEEAALQVFDELLDGIHRDVRRSIDAIDAGLKRLESA